MKNELTTQEPTPQETNSISDEVEGKESNQLDKIDFISIGDEINVFIEHIDSLATTFPFTTGVLEMMMVTSHDEFNKFLENKCESTEQDSEGNKIYTVETHNFTEFRKLQKQSKSGEIALKIVPISLLVSLVSQFDSFLGRLIKALFYIKPELLNASEKQLSFSQLIEFQSIENAKEFIVEKEIEGVLRKSHSEQFDWLENKFKIPLRKDLPAWKLFIELTERRNIFVHSNGIISSQYLKVCKENSVNLEDNSKVGQQLSVTSDYFKNAYKCIYEIGVKLAQVLWRKVVSDDLLIADKHLNNTAYDLIREENYSLAIILLDFATKDLHNKRTSDEQKRVSIINRAQAYKWIDNLTEALEIIKCEDWSATSIEFKQAVAVIEDRFVDAANYMKQIGNKSSPDKSSYKEWPLFKEFRKTEHFLTTFEEVFGEKYKTATKENEDGNLPMDFSIEVLAS